MVNDLRFLSSKSPVSQGFNVIFIFYKHHTEHRRLIKNVRFIYMVYRIFNKLIFVLPKPYVNVFSFISEINVMGNTGMYVL